MAAAGAGSLAWQSCGCMWSRRCAFAARIPVSDWSGVADSQRRTFEAAYSDSACSKNFLRRSRTSSGLVEASDRARDPCQFAVLKMRLHAGRGRVGQEIFAAAGKKRRTCDARPHPDVVFERQPIGRGRASTDRTSSRNCRRDFASVRGSPDAWPTRA